MRVLVSMDSTVHYLQSQQLGNMETSLERVEEGENAQEDEWKNIQVMLNCICGMVEKTQSAISILQQRQANIVDIRTTEELVAEVQTKASIAIMEVKQAALENIREAEAENKDKVRSLNKEACWNCGHPAIKTCSGCN